METSSDLSYPASTNLVEVITSATGTTTSIAAADNAWHVITGEVNTSGLQAPNGETAIYVDTGVPANRRRQMEFTNYLQGVPSLFSASFGTVGVCATAQQVMTGDIAEAIAIVYPANTIQGTTNFYYGQLSDAQVAALHANQAYLLRIERCAPLLCADDFKWFWYIPFRDSKRHQRCRHASGN